MKLGQVQQGGMRKADEPSASLSNRSKVPRFPEQDRPRYKLRNPAMRHTHGCPSGRLLPFAERKNLFGDKLAERSDTLGVAQFFGIGQKHRHFAALHL